MSSPRSYRMATSFPAGLGTVPPKFIDVLRISVQYVAFKQCAVHVRRLLLCSAAVLASVIAPATFGAATAPEVTAVWRTGIHLDLFRTNSQHLDLFATGSDGPVRGVVDQIIEGLPWSEFGQA